jgi:hypothetical protein
MLIGMILFCAASVIGEQTHRKKRPAVLKEEIGEYKRDILEKSADIRIELARLDKMIVKSGAILMDDGAAFSNASSEQLQRYAEKMKSLRSHLDQEMKRIQEDIYFMRSCIEKEKI